MKFTHDPNANANGTCYQACVRVSPVELVDLFGEPEAGDEYKISMEYTFVGEDGSVVTLYDWKETSLYDEDYPHPSEFRASTRAQEFHIGGHSSRAATLFHRWLHDQRMAHARGEHPQAARASDVNCDECKGTGWYVGFRGFKEPCSRGCPVG